MDSKKEYVTPPYSQTFINVCNSLEKKIDTFNKVQTDNGVPLKEAQTNTIQFLTKNIKIPDESLKQWLEEKLKLFPDDMVPSARGLYDGYLNTLNKIKELESDGLFVWRSDIENMPLETYIVLQHEHGIEGIAFFNGSWKYWYTGVKVPKLVLETAVRYMVLDLNRAGRPYSL